MARGETRGQTEARNIASQQNVQAQQLFGTLLPQYEGILANPGYDPATKSAITTAALGGAGARYDAAREAARNRVARTRNQAGFIEQEDELARREADTAAQTAAGLQKSFADTAREQQFTALRGVQGLYGIDEETMAKLLETAAQRGQRTDIGGILQGGARAAGTAAAIF